MSSKTPVIPSKVFSALNGVEVMECILKRIRQEMESDDRFGLALTYPVVEWEWEMRMRFYPSNSDGDRIKLEIKQREAARDSAEVPLVVEPITAKLTGEHKTDQPDRTRHEHQLPISQPTRNEQGRFVDRPVAPEKPAISIPTLDDEDEL